jgi:hypothetical protein
MFMAGNQEQRDSKSIWAVLPAALIPMYENISAVATPNCTVAPSSETHLTCAGLLHNSTVIAVSKGINMSIDKFIMKLDDYKSL